MSDHENAEGGEVSEVTSLDPDAADTPISDGDTTDGEQTGPDAHSGRGEEDDWYGGGPTPGDPTRDK